MESLVVRDPEILNGTLIFAGTRVPVKNLFDYLAAGNSIDVFLEDFPTVSHENVVHFLRLLEEQTTNPAA